MSLSYLEMVKIAKEISDISELGPYLKFGNSDMTAFKQENSKNLLLKEGTQTMLGLWYQQEGSTKERLVQALKLIKMGKLALRVEEGILTGEDKQFLNDPDEQKPHEVSNDAVSDGKLNALADLVPPAKYNELTIKLGTEYNHARSILMKNLANSTDAIRECLAIWKTRTGGSSVELKKILESAEIGGLVQYVK